MSMEPFVVRFWVCVPLCCVLCSALCGMSVVCAVCCGLWAVGCGDGTVIGSGSGC
jgi:hypothetical protein